MKAIRTLRGIWLRYNTFLTENGELIKVYPYRIMGGYYDLLPLKCFMQIHGDVIKNVIEE